MFRRNNSDSNANAEASGDSQAPVGPEEKKGRPTPSRKEAEAAARARAKTPRTRKEIAAAQRAARAQGSAKMREAMKTGDDRYLPVRDRGPMRRFIRDYVDVRVSFIELLIPVLVVSLILGWTGNTKLVGFSEIVLLAAMVMMVLDMVMLRFRLHRELARRFPGESTKGATYYAVMRSMQMKFMRLPKAQVKLGAALPKQYR